MPMRLVDVPVRAKLCQVDPAIGHVAGVVGAGQVVMKLLELLDDHAIPFSKPPT